MIRATYTAQTYSPAEIGVRYVRKAYDGDKYLWCEARHSMHPHDMRQGVCDAEDLPADVRRAADESRYCSFVPWPITQTASSV